MTLREALANKSGAPQNNVPNSNANIKRNTLRQKLLDQGIEVKTFAPTVYEPKLNFGERALKEAVSLTHRIGEGALDVGNAAADAFIQLGSSQANPYYWFNQDKLKEHQAIARDLIKDTNTEATKKAFGYTTEMQQQLDSGSTFGSDKIAGQIARGVGAEATKAVITGGLSGGNIETAIKLSPIISAMQGYGSGVESAYKSGVTDRTTANIAGAANAAVEYITDKIVPGSPGFRNVPEASRTIGRALADYGFNVFGEGGEEWLSAVLGPIVNEYIYTGKKEDNVIEKGISGFKKIDFKQALLDGIAGAITAGVMDGSGLVGNVNKVNQIQQNNQKQLNTINQQDISTPENQSVKKISRPEYNSIETFTNKEKTPLRTDKFTFISAENPNAKQASPEFNKQQNERLKQRLDELGVEYQEVKGHYGGNVENSFYIPNLDVKKAQQLSKEFGQESVLTSEGMLYNDGSKNPIDLNNIEFNQDAQDYYTEMQIGDQTVKIQIPVDFDTKIPATTQTPLQTAENTKIKAYHGSEQDFDTFDKTKINENETDAPFNGFWFSSNKDYANPARQKAKFKNQFELDIKNPAPYNVWNKVQQDVFEELKKNSNLDSEKSSQTLVRERLQKMGYDGVIYSQKPSNFFDINSNQKEIHYKDARGSDKTLIRQEDGTYNLYNGKIANDYTYNLNVGTLKEFNDFVDETYVAFEPNQITKINDKQQTQPTTQETPLPGRQVEKEDQYAKSKFAQRIITDKTFSEDINEELDKMDYLIKTNNKSYNNFLDNLGKKGYKNYVEELNTKFNNNQVFDATDIMAYQALVIEAKNRGDNETALELLKNIATMDTKYGQFIQSTGWISKMSPEGKAEIVVKKENNLNKMLNEKTHKKIYNQKKNQASAERLMKTYDKHLRRQAVRDAMIEYKDQIITEGSNKKLKKQLQIENKDILAIEKQLGIKSTFPSVKKEGTALVEVSKMNVNEQQNAIDNVAKILINKYGMQGNDARIMANKINTRYLEHIKARRTAALNKQVTDKVTVSEETMNRILNGKTTEEVDNAVQDAMTEMSMQIPPTMRERFSYYTTFSTLANPKTHAKNWLSNKVMQQAVKGKDKLRGTMEDIVAKNFIPDMERTATGRKATPDKVEYANSLIPKFEDLIRGEQKFEIGTGKIKSGQKMLPGLLDDVAKYNLKKLQDADFNSSSQTFARSLANNMEANNYTPEFIQSGTPQAQLALNKMVEYAVKDAEEATFRQYSKWANSLNKIQNDWGIAGDVIIGGAIKFKKTPINIAKTSFEYSPAMFAKTFYDLKTGKINANQAIDGFAKGTTGSGLMALGGMLAAAGILNGSENDDEEGKTPYSINVFGGTYTIDWLAPAAIPMFIGANIFDGIKNGTYTSGDINDLETYMAMVDTIADPFKDATILDGVNNVLQNFDYTGKTDVFDQILTNTALSYASQFVPSIGGAIARTIDPVRRDTGGEGTGINKAVSRFVAQQKGKIPFVSQGLEPYYNDYGEKEVENDMLKRAIQNFVSPGYFKKNK